MRDSKFSETDQDENLRRAIEYGFDNWSARLSVVEFLAKQNSHNDKENDEDDVNVAK